MSFSLKDDFKEEEKLLLESLSSGNFSQGKFVKDFEGKFKRYIGCKYATATMNGTAALHLALKALEIGPGDEVIVPSMTFIASANSVSYCNGIPIFVDCLKDTFCIDPEKIEEKITDKTKAIMVVHLFGNVCDMDKINAIARKHNLKVVEDAAEAHGAEYFGKKAGALGNISCFSFYSNKIITTGEGGMCLTDNAVLKEKMDLLRAQGKKKREELKDGEEYAQKQFYHDILGFNYRMTDLQAAVGVAQIDKIDAYLAGRKKIAEKFNKLLKDKDIILPYVSNNVKHAFWAYPILLANKETQVDIMNKARMLKLPVRSFFYPCHKQPFYSVDIDLPISDMVSEVGIVLPTDISEEMAIKIVNLFLDNKKI